MGDRTLYHNKYQKKYGLKKNGRLFFMKCVGVAFIIVGILSFALVVLVGSLFFPIGPDGLSPQDAVIQRIMSNLEILSGVSFVAGFSITCLGFIVGVYRSSLKSTGHSTG